MNDTIKDHDLWKDVYHVDPDKRPWTYDCEGNKIVKTEDGEPDYTQKWNELYDTDDTDIR